MSLRLFLITQFAESRHLTPLMQRHAMHPYLMMVLLSAWIASVCNFSLWQAMRQLPQLPQGSVFTVGLALILLIMGAMMVLMSVFNWRYIFKPAMTALLLLVAMNLYAMFQEGSFLHIDLIQRWMREPVPLIKSLFNWTFFWCLVVIFGAPTLYLWQCPLRRYSMLGYLKLNLGGTVIVLITMLCLVIWRYPGLSSLLLHKPELRALINPINVGWGFYTL
jgi:lipid A ethanolaminephosphotransferase